VKAKGFAQDLDQSICAHVVPELLTLLADATTGHWLFATIGGYIDGYSQLNNRLFRDDLLYFQRFSGVPGARKLHDVSSFVSDGTSNGTPKSQVISLAVS
jgi:hypothetical protein